MVIGHVHATVKIQYRDRFGRFAAMLEEAAVATARELTDKATELARDNAPERTGALKAGIRARYAGKVGYVESTAPHAHPVEEGSIAHTIPNAFGNQGSSALHPGNQAQPYLKQVPGQLAPMAPGIAERHYP